MKKVFENNAEELFIENPAPQSLPALRHIKSEKTNS
jgi:hypothetical protein